MFSDACDSSRGASDLVDPRSGFCSRTKTFHSLRRAYPLPPRARPLSISSFALSFHPTPLPSERPLLIDGTSHTTVSFREFHRQVGSLSSGLRSSFGLRKGSVAFVLSPNSLQVPVLYLALFSIGAVIAPSNPICTKDEIARQIRLVSPSIAFVTSNTAHLVPPGLKTVHIDSPLFRSLLLSETRGGGSSEDQVNNLQDETAVILFSSGTTGPAKAAAESHRNYIAMIVALRETRRRLPQTAGEVALVAAPLFHSFGLFFSVAMLAMGSTVVLMRRPTVRGMLEAAERYGVTTMTVAPPVVVAMASGEVAGGIDLSRLEEVISGGAVLHEASAKQFVATFPWVAIRSGYGLTEAGSVSLRAMDEWQNYTSAGRLNQNIEAKIVDLGTGESLSVDQRGELRLKGPAVMKGYVGDPAATASTFDTEGFLKTGDVCYIDRDGHLYVVDRLKELIKYKGYQVPPAELEALLHSMPNVADAAVVPYPHHEAGEIPMAFVVRKQGAAAISGSEIMAFVANKVAPYKKVRKVAFIDRIPRNPAGKILRRELVSRALSGGTSAAARL